MKYLLIFGMAITHTLCGMEIEQCPSNDTKFTAFDGLKQMHHEKSTDYNESQQVTTETYYLTFNDGFTITAQKQISPDQYTSFMITFAHASAEKQSYGPQAQEAFETITSL